MRTRAVLALAVLCALPLAALPAQAAGRAQSAVGDVTSGPVHFVFSAKRAAGAPATRATGRFDGRIAQAGQQVLRLAGPVTCLQVQGGTVGFFYPVDESDPAAVAMFGAGIQINLATDGRGHATGFSFVPSPTRTTASCAPAPAPVPVSGKVALRS